MMSINNRQVVLLEIDHEILLSRLSTRIGVSGSALDWFRSYLTGWSSRVDIASELSDPITANFGLPQGSVVGPIGYSIYTLPVGDIARHHQVNYIMSTLTIHNYMYLLIQQHLMDW